MGRAEPLALLEEELERAAAGEFRCVLVLGEPGVGKSRLAGELVARRRGVVTALAARAHPLGATTAFGVWAEALERHLRSLPAEEVERLCAGFLDDVARLLRSVAAVRGRGPEHEPPRGRLLEGLDPILKDAELGQDAAVSIVALLDEILVAEQPPLAVGPGAPPVFAPRVRSATLPSSTRAGVA